MTRAERSEALSGDAIEDEIPAQWLVDGLVVNRDLSMSVGWAVEYPGLATADDGEREEVWAGWRSLLHLLPAGCDLQVAWARRPRAAEALAAHAAVPDPEGLVGEVLREERRAMDAGFARADLGLHAGHVFLVRASGLPRRELRRRTQEHLAGQHDRGPASWPGAAWAWLEANLLDPAAGARWQWEEYVAARGALLEAAESVQDALAALRLRPRLLDGAGWVATFHEWWNPLSAEAGVRPAAWLARGWRPLSEACVRGPVCRRADGFLEMDGAVHAFVTLRLPPEEFAHGLWSDLAFDLGLGRARVSAVFRPGDVARRLKRLRDQLPLVRAQSVRDPTFAVVAEEVEAEIRDLTRDGGRVWDGLHVVHLWDPDAQVLRRRAFDLRRAAEERAGMVLCEETIGAWEYWRAVQPGWTRDTDRYRCHSYTSHQAAGLLPAVGEPTGQESSPGALWETAHGSIFNLRLHDERLTNNANALVVGGSGTGKSFLVNDLLLQHAGQNPQVVVVDLGGSFRPLCEILGGRYIDLEPGGGSVRLNPLEGLGAGTEPEGRDAALLFVEKLVVDPRRERRLAREALSALEQALGQVLLRAAGREVFLGDLREMLAAYPDGRVLAQRLAPWCSGGRYGGLFDGPSTLPVDSRLTVFDLARVQENEDLAPVMFATILQRVMGLARAPGTGPRFLVFDEAWKMLEDEIVAAFVVTAFRALRKQGFATIGISQGVEEFARTQNRTAILNNLSHLVILRQNGEAAAEELVRQLGLNDREGVLVRGLQSRPGRYSEALVVQRLSDGRKRSVVVRVPATPLAYWCFTTRSRERWVRQSRVDAGKNLADAIRELAAEHPEGLASD